VSADGSGEYRVDELACSHARTALREAKEELSTISAKFFNDSTFCRSLSERQDTGRRMNSAIARITTAQHWLGVYEDHPIG
jgi:hypothetical protein